MSERALSFGPGRGLAGVLAEPSAPVAGRPAFLLLNAGLLPHTGPSRLYVRLARALAGVINVLDPDVIVLGGGISIIRRLYANVPRLWRRYVFSDRVATRLVRNRHGDSSGVRGAAWLWGRTGDKREKREKR